MRPIACLLATSLLLPSPGSAQSGFTPGGRDLFVLDLASVSLGEFPKQLRLLQGEVTVVDNFGMHMLRASDPVVLLIPLREVMPNDFTLEVDIVPKVECNGEDIAFEGTATINQGPASMNVLWQSSHVALIGGAADNLEIPMPEDLKAQAPGNITEVRASVVGGTLKLYTNGREIVNVSGKQFVRGRLLRILLGGQDDRACAVHLAKLRVATNSPPP